MLRRIYDNHGQIVLLTAASMVVLCGMAALAVDVGFLYDVKRRAQIAADAGAVAGAIEVARNPAIADMDLDVKVRAETAINAFTHAAGGITVTVNHAPLAGYYAGNNGYVEVIVNRPTPTFFMRVLGHTSAVVSARAVAGMSSSLGCLYALTTEAGKGLWIKNEKTLHAENCEIYVNSDMFVEGTADVYAASMNISRSQTGALGSYHGTVNNPVPITPDPLDYLIFPDSVFDSCGGELKISNGTTVANPGCYSKITVENTTAPVTFNPGLYYAKDGVFLNPLTNVTGNGVTFFVQNDKFEMAGLANFRSPTSGPCAGILIFLKKDTNKDIEIKNTAEVHLQGTIYTRSGKILFTGRSIGTLDYSILVANEIEFTDQREVYFNNDFSGVAGGSPIRKPTLGE
jgi:Flp pilus assembly protein TadG